MVDSMDRSTARAQAMKLIYEWEMGGDGGEDVRRGGGELRGARRRRGGLRPGGEPQGKERAGGGPKGARRRGVRCVAHDVDQ